MRLLNKYYLSFFISLLFGLWAYWYWESNIHSIETKGNELYTAFITKEIYEEIAVANKELKAISDISTSQGSLERIVKLKLKYPVYFYKGGYLYFWSDNKYVPKYTQFNAEHDVGYLQLSIGKFIYVRKELSNGLEAYSLIPLAFEYSISNNYINSGLNDDIFNHENVGISNIHIKGSHPVFMNDGTFLFSIDFTSAKNIIDKENLYWLVGLISLSIVFALVCLFNVVNNLTRTNKIAWATITLIGGLVIIRWGMLYMNFPYTFIPLDLFNSKYFATSEISPSLGDLGLNIIAFSFISWFVLMNYSKSKLIEIVILYRGKARYFLGILLSATSLAILFYLSYIYSEIYSNAQFSLDVTKDITVNQFKIISLIIFFLASVIYFIYNHVALRLYILLMEGKGRLTKFYPLLLVSIIAEVLMILAGEKNWILIPVNLLYWLVLIYFMLPKKIVTLKYSTYLYFLLTAFVCSFTGAINLYYVNAEKSIIEKNKYAFQLLNENDLFAEYLLRESMDFIENDKFIATRFRSFFSSKELIIQKIKKVVLPEYLEKYEVNVSVFDSQGGVIIKNAEYSNYNEAYSLYAKDTFATDHKDVYLLQEKNNSPLKRYMGFVKIYDNGDFVGSIVLELVHKKNSPNSVYPELLVDKKYITPRQFNSYQYGIFDTKLLLSKGNFNYEKHFNDSIFNLKELYLEGVSINELHHLGIKSADGKIVIVTSDRYSFINVLSNFSFLFFLLLVFVVLFLAGYMYYFQYQKVPLNYAAKILVYLNVAFFLPLVIVSIVTLSLISNYYKTSQNKSFVKKAESLSVTILDHLESYQDDPNWESKLESDIAQLASFTGSDINLFDNSGSLLYSYHPALYERSLLSKQLNSEAFIEIMHNGATEVMLHESLGSLNYHSVYMPVKSYRTGDLLGILSIPFFESREELNNQLIGIFTTTLNIFSVIFIVFAGLSYLASRILTDPLNIITQKIRKTTFGENVPLDWKSKDEIGLLIAEYNSMLLKLEENRLALSKSEKESAWREMAKQVAHEIKNPLTPMKLKIQYLQRSWGLRDENVEVQTIEGLKSLLDQVNILSEIA